MGLISPGGENLLHFLKLRQVLSTYDGDFRDTLWWPQERPVPMELLGGLSGFLSCRCRCLRHCVESVPEPEESSPVLTWIVGYFLSLLRGVTLRLEWWHARGLSSRAVAAGSYFCRVDQRICGFRLRLSTRISHEAFHRAVPRATVV